MPQSLVNLLFGLTTHGQGVGHQLVAGLVELGFDDGTFWPADFERFDYLEEMLK